MNKEENITTYSRRDKQDTPETKPGVHLRAMEPEDLDLLYTIENDTTLWNVGLTNVPYSRYLLHDYIANTSGDIYTDKQVRLIIENNTRDVVGIIDVVNFVPQHSRAEIGIVIKQNFRKHGYAKEAIIRIIHYARNVLHLHQIYAYTDVSNNAAQQLFKTVGFKHGATLHNWLFDGKAYHDVMLFQLFL